MRVHPPGNIFTKEILQTIIYILKIPYHNPRGLTAHEPNGGIEERSVLHHQEMHVSFS